MTNSDMPAMPCQPLGQDGMSSHEMTYGLTKREMFAMHFMQAWIQHHGASGAYGFTATGAAESAIECADALLEKLEQAK